MAYKFKYDPYSLQEYAAVVQADETNVTVDEWNAMSKAERKKHLAAFNKAERKLMKEAWEDAEMEDRGRERERGNADPVPPGGDLKQQPPKKSKLKAPSLQPGSLEYENATGALVTRRDSGGAWREWFTEKSPFAVEQRQFLRDKAAGVGASAKTRPAKKSKFAPGVAEAIAENKKRGFDPYGNELAQPAQQ